MDKKPNLVTLSHGGGVQTTTMCEMIVLGELPKPDAVIFSDTGDEPSYVIDKRMTKAGCLSWLERNNLPIPLSSHCRKCPLISDGRVIEMMTHDPAGYKNRLQFDQDLRSGALRIAATAKGELYVHQTCV